MGENSRGASAGARRLVRVVAGLAAAVCAVAIVPAAMADESPVGLQGSATRTYVTPGAAQGFAGTYDRAGGAREFTDRLGAPSGAGRDALVLRTPGDEDKVMFATDQVAGPLERFRSSSYYALRDPASTADPSLLPSFQIGVDINGGTVEPGDVWVLTFRPSGGAAGSWTRYDTGAGRYCMVQQIGGLDAYRAGCDDGEPMSLDEIIAQHPGVSVLLAGVNQGGGNGGLVSAVDLIQVGSRTFDFEREVPA
ncbi:MAG: hypothetical protein L0I76_26445 [Pseudonocardia sp.]|nr:hypothetical protein [Pseudonocardia sp.]